MAQKSNKLRTISASKFSFIHSASTMCSLDKILRISNLGQNEQVQERVRSFLTDDKFFAEFLLIPSYSFLTIAPFISLLSNQISIIFRTLERVEILELIYGHLRGYPVLTTTSKSSIIPNCSVDFKRRVISGAIVRIPTVLVNI